MSDRITDIITRLRADAVIGGGWASIHTSDLEMLANWIKCQHVNIDMLKAERAETDSLSRW